MDLVQWLGAQLDEDQRIAEAARGQLEGRWSHDASIPNGYVYDERGGTVVYDESAPSPEEAEHIAAHDPARVLREIEAKRAIVARYERAMENRRAHPKDLASAGALLALHGVVELLALPYADRPGYRGEWAL